MHVFIASAPALLHEVQLAQASIHVTCVYVCRYNVYIQSVYVPEKF